MRPSAIKLSDHMDRVHHLSTAFVERIVIENTNENVFNVVQLWMRNDERKGK